MRIFASMHLCPFFRKMESIDLVSKATVDDLIFQKFESPLPVGQDDEDPFIKGEFDVIKELLEKYPACVEGKKKIDRVIDVCGPPPKGLSKVFLDKHHRYPTHVFRHWYSEFERVHY